MWLWLSRPFGGESATLPQTSLPLEAGRPEKKPPPYLRLPPSCPCSAQQLATGEPLEQGAGEVPARPPALVPVAGPGKLPPKPRKKRLDLHPDTGPPKTISGVTHKTRKGAKWATAAIPQPPPSLPSNHPQTLSAHKPKPIRQQPRHQHHPVTHASSLCHPPETQRRSGYVAAAGSADTSALSLEGRVVWPHWCGQGD